jgi:GNAT superfamily N-acetyltransferase
MFERRENYLYLGRLSVPPEYRGRGIASTLIDYVEAEARRLHLESVQLGTRLVLRQIREKYERRGYRVIRYETHAGYAEPTYVTMEKWV